MIFNAFRDPFELDEREENRKDSVLALETRFETNNRHRRFFVRIDSEIANRPVPRSLRDATHDLDFLRPG